MYAVKKQNPLSFRAYTGDPGLVESDEVYCDFLVTETMIYDSVTNTVRVKNNTELLNSLKLSKESELRAAREKHEKKGFVSTALGTAHTYLSNELDQKVNVIAAGLHTAIGRKFICLDQSNLDNFVYHNNVQMQKVLDDGDAFVQESYRRLYEDLIEAVRAIDISATYPTLADAEAAIATIVWTDTW